MAVNAKDGSRHHSASRARLHDEMAAGKAGGGAPKVKTMQPAGAGAGAASQYPEPTSTPIEEHVQEHGPAHTVVHEHDQATNTHHVSSFHGDAAKGDNDHPGAHHSRHKSHAAAHEHMGKAMGVEHGETEETPDEADMGAGNDEGDEEETSGVPGMS